MSPRRIWAKKSEGSVAAQAGLGDRDPRLELVLRAVDVGNLG